MPPTTVRPDYYAILRIPPSADSAAIKSAYRRLALAKHPDRRKNEPNATAEFQLLNEAYEELFNVDKRREYDRIYQSTVGPREAKDRRIAELERLLRQTEYELEAADNLLRNTKKDLHRLYAERDSIKGERERIVREQATQETWWLYFRSFMPGKAAEYTRQRQQRDRVMTEIIGKQRTKECHIDRKRAEEKSRGEKVTSILTAQNNIKERIQRTIEEPWSQTLLRYKVVEKMRAKYNGQSERADWAQAACRTSFAGDDGYHHFDARDF